MLNLLLQQASSQKTPLPENSVSMVSSSPSASAAPPVLAAVIAAAALPAAAPQPAKCPQIPVALQAAADEVAVAADAPARLRILAVWSTAIPGMATVPTLPVISSSGRPPFQKHLRQIRAPRPAEDPVEP